MLQFAVFAILFAAVSTGPITDQSESTDFDALFVDNIEEYLAQNPEVRIVDELEKSETLDSDDLRQIIYRFGQRVNGDRVVLDRNWAYVWAEPQAIVGARFRYPAGGSTGATVSYVHILVQQSGNIGRAVVVNGGIGQQSILVMIEARRTSFLRYHAQVFGSDAPPSSIITQ